MVGWHAAKQLPQRPALWAPGVQSRHAQPCCRLRARAQQGKDWTPPWAITFDLRERETDWTPENQARLVKLFAAEQLDIDVLDAELRVAQLCLLIPQLRSRIPTLKPELLAQLLRDPAAIAARLAALREALPALDLGSFAALAPHVLLRDAGVIIGEVARLAELLGIDSVAAQRIVNSHPRFLDSGLVAEVLAELRLLMPGKDAAQTLQREPSWLLRLERGPGRLGPHPDDI